jgi:hypothetical protein
MPDPWVIERFNSILDLDASGAFIAREAIDVDFGLLSRPGLTREIVVVQRVDDRHVRQFPISILAANNAQGQPYPVESSTRAGMQRFQLGDPRAAVAGKQNYRLAYQVRRALTGTANYDQLKWIDSELSNSSEKWKIVFFHHPLYSSARTHGSSLKLREVLEPMFIKYNVSLVLNGHDHTYERIKPQNGIQYFVEGSSGQLRNGDIRKDSPLTAFGLDTDRAFMLMEIDGDTLTFNTISRTGTIVDSGTWTRRK